MSKQVTVKFIKEIGRYIYEFEYGENILTFKCVKQDINKTLEKANNGDLFEVQTQEDKGIIWLNSLIPVAKTQKTLTDSIETKTEKYPPVNNTFQELYNMSCKTEKKGKFNYISWATCWAKIKEYDSNATFKVYQAEDGFPCWIKKGIGAFVKVGVTINGLEHIEFHPVLDNNNNSMIEKEYEKEYKSKSGVVSKVEQVSKISSFDINNAVKRCLVKACAFHGFGLKLYDGEELGELENE